MPLCRDEISKKVTGSLRGTSCHVEAQVILCNTFGMELVELPTLAAAHDASGAATAGQDKNQDKAGTQKGEHAGERQTVPGLQKTRVICTLSF